jgi:hypothetical protein
MSRSATSAAPAPDAFGERDAKALTECMTVLDDSTFRELRDEEFLVVTPTGTYRVDTIAESCDCPDSLHRAPERGCKHRLRVAFARGIRPIPAWVDRDAIDDQLGQHLSADPRIATPAGSEVFDDAV